MRRATNFITVFLAFVLAAFPATARAQPAVEPMARMVGMKEWRVELKLVYDNNESKSRTEHAISTWTGELRRDESYWDDGPPFTKLRWIGDMSVRIDGIVKLVSGKCRSEITANGNDDYGFAISMTQAGYEFGQGYCGTSFGTQVWHCPGKPDETSPYGGVTYSPQSWRVVRPLPNGDGTISGNATLDHKSPNQVAGEPLRRGQKLKVTWKFTPVQDFVCGPDVTIAVATALAQMRNYFVEGLGHKDKVLNCLALHGEPFSAVAPPVNALWRAWDIKPLAWFNAIWLDTYTKGGTCDIPGDGVTNSDEDPNTCKHSVRHSGLCVLAGTLNYFAFGHMHRLCYDYAIERSELRNQHLLCVARLGGCASSRDGGHPTDDNLKDYNDRCRLETGYPGTIAPTSDECSNPPARPDPDDVLNPTDWAKPNMAWYIEKYKEATLSPGDIVAPTAFAEAAWDAGEMAVPPIENRYRCTGQCSARPQVRPFAWTWYPGHVSP